MKFSSALIFASISSVLASGGDGYGGGKGDSAVWSFAPTSSWTSYTTSVSPAPSLSWSSYSHSKSGHGKESKSYSASAPLTTFSVFPTSYTSSWSTPTANATAPVVSTPKTPTAPSASAPAQVSANAAVHQTWSAAAGIIALAGLALV